MQAKELSAHGGVGRNPAQDTRPGEAGTSKLQCEPISKPIQLGVYVSLHLSFNCIGKAV